MFKLTTCACSILQRFWFDNNSCIYRRLYWIFHFMYVVIYMRCFRGLFYFHFYLSIFFLYIGKFIYLPAAWLEAKLLKHFSNHQTRIMKITCYSIRSLSRKNFYTILISLKVVIPHTWWFDRSTVHQGLFWCLVFYWCRYVNNWLCSNKSTN